MGEKKIKKLLPFFTHSGLNKHYISLASLGEIKNIEMVSRIFCFYRKWWNSVEFLHKSSTFLMPDFVHHFLSHHHVRSQLSSQLLFAVSNNIQLLLITSGLAIVNHLRKKFIFKQIEKLDEKLMRKRGFEGGNIRILKGFFFTSLLFLSRLWSL